MLVYSTGLAYYGIDGVYVFSDYYNDFIQIDDITWENREDNTNEFSFGFSIDYFEGLTSMMVASQSGSFNEDGPDIVPNEGMVELFLAFLGYLLIRKVESFHQGLLLILGVVFDATGLFGGDYEATIEISSNDPMSPVVEIPAYLNVTGIPIVDFPTEVDFGQVYVGYPDTVEYIITNSGTDLLLINNFTFQDTWLSSIETELSISPLSETSLHLVANVNDPEIYTTIMGFMTNDPTNSNVENVMVVATAIVPPVMNVSPSDFVFTHNTETFETTELTISNTGGSTLEWQMGFESLGGSSDDWYFFEKTDYGDFSSENNQDRITDNVWITRDNSGPIFNYYLENGPEYGCASQTPSGTLWSPNPKEVSEENDYAPFIEMTGCCPPCMVGDTVSVWLVQEDLRLNIVFDSWTSGGQGGVFLTIENMRHPSGLKSLRWKDS